ncbi:MAG: amino acid ABC transporter substrate-binding protein [Ramlibacter sp.]
MTLNKSRLAIAVLSAGIVGTFAHAAEPAGTLKKVKESGTMTLGVRETSVPFSYQDDKQQFMGYSLDLCMKVVDEVKKELALPNLKVELVPTKPATRIPLLANGTTDLQCDGASITAERKNQIAFSPTIFFTGNRLLTKKSSNVKTLDDLKGKPIVSVSGTTNIKQISQLNTERQLGMNVLTASEDNEAFMMVDTGRAVAFAQDDIHSAALIANAKNPDAYVISDESLSADPYGLMFRRDDPQFKSLVDKAIIGVFQSGEINKIYAKWFQSPIPPKGTNLNWPMSKYLKAAIAHPTDSHDPNHYFSLVK